MKILHINCNFLGTELHQNLIEKLNDRGLSDLVYVAASSLDCSFPIRVKDVVSSACFGRRDRFFFHTKQRKIYSDLTSKVDVKSFDAIHAYTLFTDGNNARRLSKEFGIPYIATVRGTDIDVFFKYMIHLRRVGINVMRDACKIIFLSESARKTVFAKYIPKRYSEELLKKTEVIPNGIDDFWFDNPNRSPKTATDVPVRLISVGKINKNKNFAAVISAMSELKKRGIASKLTVIGKNCDDEVLRTIQNSPDTLYHDAVPKEKLIDFYRANDIFVLTSYIETFGLVYAEALSQGLPVVYTRGQGFDMQFCEGEVGYHADPNDPVNIAEAVCSVLDNYQTIAGRAPERAKKFEWDGIASQYERIYQSVVG